MNDPETYAILRLPEVLHLRGRGKTAQAVQMKLSGATDADITRYFDLAEGTVRHRFYHQVPDNFPELLPAGCQP
jgi:hypothetical protein